MSGNLTCSQLVTSYIQVRGINHLYASALQCMKATAKPDALPVTASFHVPRKHARACKPVEQTAVVYTYDKEHSSRAPTLLAL